MFRDVSRMPYEWKGYQKHTITTISLIIAEQNYNHFNYQEIYRPSNHDNSPQAGFL